MPSTSTMLKGIYLQPSAPSPVRSAQTGADTSPTATRHKRFLTLFRLHRQGRTMETSHPAEQADTAEKDPVAERTYGDQWNPMAESASIAGIGPAQAQAKSLRQRQAAIPPRARTIHDAIRREQLPSLFAELFNAVLFGGRSFIKKEDINSLPDYPSYLMRSSRFGVDLFLLDFTAIFHNYDVWLLSSSLSGRRFSPVIVLALYDSEIEMPNGLLNLLMNASVKDSRIHLLDIQEPDFFSRISPSLRELITGKQTTYLGTESET